MLSGASHLMGSLMALSWSCLKYSLDESMTLSKPKISNFDDKVHIHPEVIICQLNSANIVMVLNLHAIPGRQVSVDDSLASKILHSLSNLNAHVQQPFFY